MGYNSSVDRDLTWPGINVGYAVSYQLEVFYHLTLAAGTKVVFDRNCGMTVHMQTGGLIANGTEAKPVVLTSSEKTPGSWYGVMLGGAGCIGQLDHVEIAYAGQSHQDNYAAINVFDQGCSVEIRNSVIRDCPLCAIWTRDASLNADAATVNTFTNVGGGIICHPN